jgi:hypothetical protein
MLRAGIFAALAVVAIAQDRTVQLLLLDTDPQSLVASVISANPSTTEYLVGCPTGTDQNDCGYNPPLTVKHAGSVYGASISAADEQFTYSWECTAYTSGETSAVCTTSAGGAQANFPGEATTTLTGSDVGFFPVIVTSGADQLAEETASATSGASTKSSGAAVATTNAATTAGVGIGLAGLAAVVMAL